MEQYFISDHHPAIVDREAWDKAQARLEQIAGKRRRKRPKQQRLIPVKKGVLRGFIPIDPTWKTVSYKRLLTATEKVVALAKPETEELQVKEESEVYNMGVLDGFKEIELQEPKSESVMTISSSSLKFNKATAVELNYPAYIKVLTNAQTRQIGIRPCSAKAKNSIKFSEEESKQHYAIILKVPAVQADFRRLFSFENEEGEKLTYSLKGTFYPEEQAIVYNLDDVKPKEEKKRQGRRKKGGTSEDNPEKS